MRPEPVLAMRRIAPDKASGDPLDRALPGYSLLCQAEPRTELLSRLLTNWLSPQAQLLETHAAPCRHVPGKRCNFQVKLLVAPLPGAAAERRQVVAKVYAKDCGAEVYRMLQEFRSHGFSSGHFLVPQPLAYDPRWKLLLLDWAEGELFRSLLLGGSDVSRRIEEAAGWLLKLHQCGVTSGRCHTLRRHLDTMEQQKQRLVKLYPESGRVLESLLRGIEEHGLALSGWTPGPTHCDFSPDHLVLNGKQLTALDFDESCQYDPMYDVAHFMAHLKLLGVRYLGAMSRFDGHAERFRAAYRADARGYSEPRLRLYQAVAFFKLAHIIGVVLRPPAWKDAVDAFLREAQRAL